MYWNRPLSNRSGDMRRFQVSLLRCLASLQHSFGVTDLEDIMRLSGGLTSSLVFRIIVHGSPYLFKIITRTKGSYASLHKQEGCVGSGPGALHQPFCKRAIASGIGGAGSAARSTADAARSTQNCLGPASSSMRRQKTSAILPSMNTPQAGIFALGTASHTYLEFDVLSPGCGPKLVAEISALREPRTTVGGVNLVVGFRPELWSQVAPDRVPAGAHGFHTAVVGPDGFTMPAAQHDAVLWLSGSAYDVLFDAAHQAIGAVKDLASVAEETSSWAYKHDRDLTGFIDGSENPSLIDASDAAVISAGQPGEGGSILLLQKWKHDTTAWESLPVDQQERIMGRRKLDSVELDNKPSDSHVASTDQDQFGKIFRRNMPYGTVTDHGTMFVGFSADQRRLSTMLESMAGLRTGVRDALTRYTRPVSGAYYFVPSTESLRTPH